MASPSKTGSQQHEIVARHDGICWKCRGKCLEGSRIVWDKATSRIEHVSCPPVVEIAAEAYRPPPVTPDLWRRYCKEISDMMIGGNTERRVVEEDRKAYEAGGFAAMLRSVMERTRCSGEKAVEIVREWLDTLKAPIDEAKLQAMNAKMKEVKCGGV